MASDNDNLLWTSQGPYTQEEAAAAPTDILLAASNYKRRLEYCSSLSDQGSDIERLIAWQLRLNSQQRCRVTPMDDWRSGSFNVGIPVTIDNWNRERVFVGVPFPWKVGEDRYPGNVDEKLRCEAATYVWIRDNCPTVPTPRLLGLGLTGPSGLTFTASHLLPFYRRIFHTCRRWLLSFLGLPCPPILPPDGRRNHFSPGYLITDFIEPSEGKLLAITWGSDKGDRHKRANLFQDMTRIILSLGRIPLPRIGAFTVCNDGVVRLLNRPLTDQIAVLESASIDTDIARDRTYSNPDEYLSDVLGCHCNRLMMQWNAVTSEKDGFEQMAVLQIMRSKLPKTTAPNFALKLTDNHQGNIFVDDDWRIKYLVDLEWAASLPTAMLHPPPALCDLTVDDTEGDAYEAFNSNREDFMEHFREQEMLISTTQDTPRTREMDDGWANGLFWIHFALSSVSGFFNVMVNNVDPDICLIDDFRSIAMEWSPDAMAIISAKVRDKENYDKELALAFAPCKE